MGEVYICTCTVQPSKRTLSIKHAIEKNLWGPLYNIISTSKERKTCIKGQNGCCQKCALLRGSTLYQKREKRDENRKTQLEKGESEPEVAGSL